MKPREEELDRLAKELADKLAGMRWPPPMPEQVEGLIYGYLERVARTGGPSAQPPECLCGETREALRQIEEYEAGRGDCGSLYSMMVAHCALNSPQST